MSVINPKQGGASRFHLVWVSSLSRFHLYSQSAAIPIIFSTCHTYLRSVRQYILLDLPVCMLMAYASDAAWHCLVASLSNTLEAKQNERSEKF